MISNDNEYSTTDQRKTRALPKVSIGIPTFNGEKRIVATLTSVIIQEYPNLEVIISDNCSPDNTRTVCTELARKYPFIQYFRQERNIGIMSNYEFVLSQATGEMFMWLADDDSLEPGILLKYVDFLTGHPDYLLVSGEIRYWQGKRPVFVEKDFSLEHASGNRRVIDYYGKVIHGATYYGLIRRATANKLPLQNRIGEDWHFVAKASYLGKVKMLDCIGYNKKLNGSSKSLQQYARLIGAPWFSASFPHTQIAIDACSEILKSPVYRDSPVVSRIMTALRSAGRILFNHYCRNYPLMVGGKIMRLLGFKKRLVSAQNA